MEHVSSTTEIKDQQTILFMKPEGKTPAGRYVTRCEYTSSSSSRMDLKSVPFANVD
jgi:hypothetical protein